MRFLVLALLLVIAAVSATANEEQKTVCEPGSQIKVDCNTCFCMHDGADGYVWACTGLACKEKFSQSRQRFPLSRYDCPPCTCTCTCS